MPNALPQWVLSETGQPNNAPGWMSFNWRKPLWDPTAVTACNGGIRLAPRTRSAPVFHLHTACVSSPDSCNTVWMKAVKMIYLVSTLFSPIKRSPATGNIWLPVAAHPGLPAKECWTINIRFSDAKTGGSKNKTTAARWQRAKDQLKCGVSVC